jgi:hypothetical protein
MSQRLVITLADNFELCFNIRQTPLAMLWLERMQHRHAWPMDNPDRFYGFGTAQQEQDRAVEMMQQCIDTINDYQRIIDREFEYTQDCLNYMHNIFERYHGLLDQQTSDFWHSAPDTVRQALANLNLAVHRCEAAQRAPRPELVCTWFGMPKIHQLSTELQQQYGEPAIKFGTVYLNYCEIGKTVEDLTRDNDQYISEDAFRPFGYYSTDFFVAFYDLDLTPMYPRIQNYIDSQQTFFSKHNIYNAHDIQASPLRFPVADLEHTDTHEQLITQIRSRQLVREVTVQ